MKKGDFDREGKGGMGHDDRNERTTGFKRANAMRERLRAKTISEELHPPREHHDDAPDLLDSLVFLLSSEPMTGVEEIRAAIENVLGATPPTDDPEAEQLAALTESLAVVTCAGWTFGVRVEAMPFFDDVAVAARKIPELRLRAAIEDHAAYLAVDLFDAPNDASPTERRSVLGKFLGALAPSNTLALHRPVTGQSALFTAEASKALLHGFVDEALQPGDQPIPIAGIDGEDPRLVAAVAEANRRLDEFLTAFAQRQPGDTFAVKMPFADDAGQEFMWVSVTHIDDKGFHGLLDNEPAFVKTVKEGETVHVPRKNLNDWMYVSNGELHGGFTLKVLGEKLTRPTRDRKRNHDDAA